MGRTLIVDDEEDIRRLLRLMIERADDGLHVAAEARNGREAVEQWRAERPDIVLIDQRMPEMTGLEAAKLILDEHPRQRVVLFTAFLDDELSRKAAELGVRVCIAKSEIFRITSVLRDVAAAV